MSRILTLETSPSGFTPYYSGAFTEFSIATGAGKLYQNSGLYEGFVVGMSTNPVKLSNELNTLDLASITFGSGIEIGTVDVRGTGDNYFNGITKAADSLDANTTYHHALYAQLTGSAGVGGGIKTGIVGSGAASTSFANGNYSGVFTTDESIYDFSTTFNTGTQIGSGVYSEKDLTIGLLIVDRNNTKILSQEALLRSPFISGIHIDILNSNGTIAQSGFQSGFKDVSFIFSEADNQQVFGSHTKNFGVQTRTVSENGFVSTGKFFLYGNEIEISTILVTDGTGQFKDENPINFIAPNTGLTNALPETNRQKVSDSNVSGQIQFQLRLENTNSKPEKISVYGTSGDVNSLTLESENLLRSFDVKSNPLNVYSFILSQEDNIVANTDYYFKFVPEGFLGTGETWTVGPYRIQSSDIATDNPIMPNVADQALQHNIGIGTTSITDSDNKALVVYAEGTTTASIAVAGTSVSDKQGNVGIRTNDPGLQFDAGNVDKANVAATETTIDGIDTVALAGSGHFVSGNANVIAGGQVASISGGNLNFIGGGTGINVDHSSFSSSIGGRNNDIFSGNFSIIGGGFSNLISGVASESHVDKVAIVGGESNKVISAPYSFIGAGNSNLISGTNSLYSTIIGGGFNKIKESQFASILGGDNNTIEFANHSVSAGNYSKVKSGHAGAFVFSDNRSSLYESTGGNTLNLRFESGVFVDTDSGIYINGNPVVTGTTAESDTLQTVTDRGATTTNAISVSNTITNRGLIVQDTYSQTKARILNDGSISGGASFLGTGVENRITKDGVPYMLSGDAVAPGSVGTLQQVTDNGATTTNAININNSSTIGLTTRGLAISNGMYNVARLLTDGSISGAGDLIVDTDALFVDVSANRVGINEDSVDATLHMTNVGGGVVNQKFERAGASAWRLGIPNGQTYFAFDDANDDLSTAKVVITKTDGYVGIGTDSPTELLEVDGNIKLGDGGARSIIGPTNESIRILANPNASDEGIAFSTDAGATTGMFIKDGNNVGIGTTNPTETLEVTGDIFINGGPAGGRSLALKRTGATNTWKLVQGHTQTDYLEILEGSDTRFLIKNGGNVGIGTVAPEFKLQVENTVSAGSDNFILNVRNTTHASDSRAGIAFRMNDNTSTNWDGAGIQAYNNGVDGAGHLGFGSVLNNTFSEHVRITSSGNVGVGTDDPETKLHVQFTGTNGLRLRSTDDDCYMYLSNSTANRNNIIYFGDNSSNFAGMIQYNHQYDYMAFRVDGGEKVRISAAGDVGIGTQAPSTKLQTIGTISGSTGRFENAKISNFNSSDYAAFGHENVADDSYAIRQHSNGNVHINCGSSRLVQFRHQNSTQGGFNASKDFFVGPSETNNTFYVDISETNVGVGTYAPIGKLTVATTMSSSPTTQLYLDVDGSNNVGGGGEVIFNTSASAGALDAYNAIVRGQRSSLNDGSSDLTFLTTHVPTSATAAARMTIKDDGNVGIGTDNPVSLLDVSGSSTYGGITVRGNIVPRVVFSGTNSVNNWGIGIHDNVGSQFAIGSNTAGHAAMTEYLVIQSDGDVGIGTNSPSVKLQTLGTISGYTGLFSGSVGIGTNDPGSYNLYVSGGGRFTTNVDFSNNHGIRSYLADGSGPIQTLRLNSSNQVCLGPESSNTYATRIAGDYITLEPSNFLGVPVEAVRVIDGGNVGIGTTIPSGNLHIENGASSRPFSTQADELIVESSSHGGISILTPNASRGHLYFNNNAFLRWVGSDDKLSINTSASSTTIAIAESAGNTSFGGNVLGTGNGNRLTTNGTPYLLSGDVAGGGGGSDTLQDVTDNGNTTTNNIIIKNNGSDPEYGALTITGGYALAHLRSTGTVAYLQFQNSTTSYGTMSNVGMTIGNNGHDAYITNRQALGNLYLATSGEVRVAIKPDGKVGIGTLTPAHELEVVGDVAISDAKKFKGLTYSSSYVNFQNDTTLSANRHITFDINGSTEAVRIEDGGNVGIGTNNPIQKLHLEFANTDTSFSNGAGGDWGSEGLLIENTSSNANTMAMIQLRNGDADFHIAGIRQGTDDSDLGFFSEGSEKVRITHDGNVGIGTISPDELLRVVGGNICVTNGQYFIFDGAGSKNHKMRSYYDGSQGHIEIVVAGNDIVDMAADGKVGIGTNTASGTLHVYTADAGGTIATNASHDDLIIENNGNCGIQLSSPASSYQYLAFGDTASANQGYVRYYHSDDSMVLRAGANDTVTIKGGDVRIGTNTNFPAGTVAGGKLDVRGDSDGQLLFDTDGGSSDIKSSYNLELWADYDNNNSAGYSNIYFKTDGDNTRMTIDNNGKVGIGNTQPSDTLQVQGQVRIDGSTTDGLTITSNSGASQGLLIYNNSNTDTASIINYYDGPLVLGQNNAEVMRLHDNGYVGIGVADPDQKLEVNGNIRIPNEGKIVFGSAGTTPSDYLELYDVGTGDTLLRLVQDGVKRFSVQGVNGHVYMQNKLQIDIGSNNNHTGEISFNTQYDTAFIRSSYTDPAATTETFLAFCANTAGASNGTVAEQMRIAGGNVGIGTTNPSQTLHVEGTARVAGHTDLASSVDISNTTRIYTKLSVGNSAWITPSQALEVGTNTDVSAQIGRAHVGYIGHADYAGFSHVDKANSTSYSLLQSAGGDTFLNCANGYQIFFRYNNTTMGGFNASHDFYVDTDTLYVDASENKVGIGTASPHGQLDVFSTRNTEAGANDAPNYHLHLHNPADDTSESIGIGFGITSAMDAVGAAIAHERKGSSSYGDLYFSTRANGGSVTERMRIDSAGNVGIGITNPSIKLEVNSAGTDEVARFQSTDNDSYISISDNTDAVYIGHDAALDVMSLGFNSSMGVSSNLSIDTAGNVGIGTNNPSVKLDVDATIKTKVYAIGSLPSASPAGQRAMVNNASSAFGSSTVGQTVSAGGSAVAPVYSDGSYWRYG